MRIFTKRFFECSPSDQAKIVDAAIADLEACATRSVDKHGRRKARQMIRRITRKAVQHGVYAEEGNVPDPSNPAGSERPGNASFSAIISNPPYGEDVFHSEGRKDK